MGQTTFSGPLVTGDREAGETAGPNLGFSVLAQQKPVVFDATLVQSVVINLPPCQIIDFIADVETVYNSATSATLSVGITPGGTEIASGVNVKAAAGRLRPTFTAAQLTAMKAFTGRTLYVTVTSVGQPTAGAVTTTLVYAQTGADD